MVFNLIFKQQYNTGIVNRSWGILWMKLRLFIQTGKQGSKKQLNTIQRQDGIFECTIGKKGNFLWGTSVFNRDVKLLLDTRAAEKKSPFYTALNIARKIIQILPICDLFPYALSSSPFNTEVRSRYKEPYNISGSTKIPVSCPGPVAARPLGCIPIFFYSQRSQTSKKPLGTGVRAALFS